MSSFTLLKATLFFVSSCCFMATTTTARPDETSITTSPFLRGGEESRKVKRTRTSSSSSSSSSTPTRHIPRIIPIGGDENENSIMECTLYLIDTEYEREEEEAKGQKWYCEFDEIVAQEQLEMNDPFVELNGISNDDLSRIILKGKEKSTSTLTTDFDSTNYNDSAQKVLESGRSVLRFRQGTIDRLAFTLNVEPSSVVEIVNTNYDDDEDRRLNNWVPVTMGGKRTLVVRITSYDGSVQPVDSTEEIRRAIFGEREGERELEPAPEGEPETDTNNNSKNGRISTRTQFERCSYNQMTLVPFDGTTLGDETRNIPPMQITDGIVDLPLSEEQSAKLAGIHKNNIMSYTREAAAAAFGDLRSQFDHVLYCLPEGVGGFLATAVVNRYNSWYTGNRCTSLPATMHEIGHNLGLNHAGELKTYDDKTGYMGLSGGRDTMKCFNVANAYKLRWYSKQTYSINPTKSQTGYQQFVVNGIADYRKTNLNREGNDNSTAINRKDRERMPLVILQLYQSMVGRDYYIGYNRKIGINEETEESPNEVLILEKLGPYYSPAETKLRGTLKVPGDVFTIENYDNMEGKFVNILLESISQDGKDAVIGVSTTKQPLPVPTSTSMAPSASTSPSVAPSVVSETPSAVPTKYSGDNDPLDKQLTDKGIKYKWKSSNNCEWVANRPNKRCSFRWKGKSVSEFWCQKTCLSSVVVDTNDDIDDRCKAGNDSTFSFNGFDRSIVKGCEWVRKRPKKTLQKEVQKEQNSISVLSRIVQALLTVPDCDASQQSWYVRTEYEYYSIGKHYHNILRRALFVFNHEIVIDRPLYGLKLYIFKNSF
uniref:Peptidase M11 gametolysin domain-containing protein n=1 Tax=Pseudo-nitzschia australis TaxID=44445 RepID=A0A7S4EHY1_9STRA|mmetsp:Transcript_6245/g.12254  ORF Transcript_6245/g.12254 Transcript_6245/m.12254 type:complete len:823 (+) Transcript_6245:66-2534(+)